MVLRPKSAAINPTVRFAADAITKPNHGSEAGIVKTQLNLKVLVVLAGRKKDFLQGLTSAWPGSSIMENVRFGASGPFPGLSGPMPRPRPVLLDPPGLVPGPHPSPSNLLAQPLTVHLTVILLIIPSKSLYGALR